MNDINIEAAEALEKAADAFESGKLRWIQGNMGWPGDNTACARGALNYVTGDDQYNTQSWHVVRRAEQAMGFEDALACNRGSLPHWNDQVCRTRQDVIDRMKEGAKRLRNGELA